MECDKHIKKKNIDIKIVIASSAKVFSMHKCFDLYKCDAESEVKERKHLYVGSFC